MDQSAHNAAVVRRLYEEAINRRNLALVDVLVGPQPHVHAQTSMDAAYGREFFKQALARQWQEAPDHQYVILDLIGRGDRVAVRLKSVFTHTAPTGNFPATGRPVEGHEICFYRLAGGLIEEVWTVTDEILIFQQVNPQPTPIARW